MANTGAIVLIRHAEREDVVHNTTDPDTAITTKGYQEAKECARIIVEKLAACSIFLTPRTIIRIASSPFRRTLETAAALREGLRTIHPEMDPELAVDPQLSEIFGPQRVKGTAGPPLLQHWREIEPQPRLTEGENLWPCAWGEDIPAGQMRMSKAFDKHKASNNGTIHVLVSHGDALQAVVQSLHPGRVVYDCDYLAFIVARPINGRWRIVHYENVHYLDDDSAEVFDHVMTPVEKDLPSRNDIVDAAVPSKDPSEDHISGRSNNPGIKEEVVETSTIEIRRPSDTVVVSTAVAATRVAPSTRERDPKPNEVHVVNIRRRRSDLDEPDRTQYIDTGAAAREAEPLIGMADFARALAPSSCAVISLQFLSPRKKLPLIFVFTTYVLFLTYTAAFRFYQRRFHVVRHVPEYAELVPSANGPKSNNHYTTFKSRAAGVAWRLVINLILFIVEVIIDTDGAPSNLLNQAAADPTFYIMWVMMLGADGLVSCPGNTV